MNPGPESLDRKVLLPSEVVAKTSAKCLDSSPSGFYIRTLAWGFWGSEVQGFRGLILGSFRVEVEKPDLFQSSLLTTRVRTVERDRAELAISSSNRRGSDTPTHMYT